MSALGSGCLQGELQIVQGVFNDLKDGTIAGDLGISPHTVKTYFQRPYAKLRVGSGRN